MKKFLKYIAQLLLLILIILEVLLRMINLAAHTLPTENVNGNYLLKPGSDSVWVRGGIGEIKNHYHINSTGWNSIIDYEQVPVSKLSVAIVGDSYIQGMQTDVEYSIGRLLEKKMADIHPLVVHEYGRGGGNIVDFKLLYKDKLKNNYDYVFILITDEDIVQRKPSFMNRGERNRPKTTFRKIYDRIYILRYLNINHGLGTKVADLLGNGPDSIERIHHRKDKDSLDMNNVNFEAVSEIDDSVIYLHENGKLDSRFINSLSNKTVLIEHHILPKDHGFDGHWNKNGRLNCANSIKKFIIKDLENNH